VYPRCSQRQIDLTHWLESNRWIYSRVGHKGWLAYQDKIQSGLMRHKATLVPREDGSEKVATQARITPKGLTRLGSALTQAA